MRNLYEYNDASYEECIDDLNTILEGLQQDLCVDDYDNNPDTLRRYGIRIQNIAERLEELEKNNE